MNPLVHSAIRFRRLGEVGEGRGLLHVVHRELSGALAHSHVVGRGRPCCRLLFLGEILHEQPRSQFLLRCGLQHRPGCPIQVHHGLVGIGLRVHGDGPLKLLLGIGNGAGVEGQAAAGRSDEQQLASGETVLLAEALGYRQLDGAAILEHALHHRQRFNRGRAVEVVPGRIGFEDAAAVGKDQRGEVAGVVLPDPAVLLFGGVRRLARQVLKLLQGLGRFGGAQFRQPVQVAVEHFHRALRRPTQHLAGELRVFVALQEVGEEVLQVLFGQAILRALDERGEIDDDAFTAVQRGLVLVSDGQRRQVSAALDRRVDLVVHVVVACAGLLQLHRDAVGVLLIEIIGDLQNLGDLRPGVAVPEQYFHVLAGQVNRVHLSNSLGRVGDFNGSRRRRCRCLGSSGRLRGSGFGCLGRLCGGRGGGFGRRLGRLGRCRRGWGWGGCATTGCEHNGRRNSEWYDFTNVHDLLSPPEMRSIKMYRIRTCQLVNCTTLLCCLISPPYP